MGPLRAKLLLTNKHCFSNNTPSALLHPQLFPRSHPKPENLLSPSQDYRGFPLWLLRILLMFVGVLQNTMSSSHCCNGLRCGSTLSHFRPSYSLVSTSRSDCYFFSSQLPTHSQLLGCQALGTCPPSEVLPALLFSALTSMLFGVNF